MKKQIILCATQRCGSTMICDDLWNTGMLGQPDECFIPWVDADIEKYNWKEQLNNVITRSSSENDVSAIKIMSDQLQGISEKMNTFLDVKQDNYLKVLPAVFQDTVWVRIVRKNSVKQAISRLMAKQTDVCHAVDEKDSFFAGKTIEYKDDYNSGVQFNYQARQ